jgi:hypothetical protein
MKKTLWLYGALVFAGGLIGGALTSMVFCRSRIVAAAPAVTEDDVKAATAAPRRIVAASEFVVLDSGGRPRAKIEVDGAGQADFSMYDRNNHPRARIVVDKLGAPSVRLYDAADKLRISLDVSSGGIPTIRLLDSGNHTRELLGVDANGDAGLDFYARDGTVLRELP